MLIESRIIKKLNELVELEESYGHLSCYDYSEEYEKMTKITEEIIDKLGHNQYKLLKDGLKDINDILEDTEEEMEIYIEDWEEIQEKYMHNWSNEAKTLYYWIDSSERREYLRVNYMVNDCNMITHDDLLNYFLMVY